MEDKNIKGMRKYKNKQGEEVIKEYNQTAYNKKFYEKHKQEINKKEICRCGGSYTKSNRTKHDKGRYHILFITHNNDIIAPPALTVAEIEDALNAYNTY